jgi:hypothetical protein
MDITNVLAMLAAVSNEFQALVKEKELVRGAEEEIRKRNEEITGKIDCLQQTLNGIALYITALGEQTPLTCDSAETDLAATIARVTRIDAASFVDRSKTLIECCREILSRKGDWMSAVEVRKALQAARFDFSQYKSNPLSSIHTTLKRIVGSGQAWNYHASSTSENYYRWKLSGEVAAPRFEEQTIEASATETKTA